MPQLRQRVPHVVMLHQKNLRPPRAHPLQLVLQQQKLVPPLKGRQRRPLPLLRVQRKHPPKLAKLLQRP